MSRTIQMKRGLLADLPQLLPGEFAFTIDTHEVFIGSAEGNVPMINSEKIAQLELNYETAAAALELTYAPELANLKASDTSIAAQIVAFNQTIQSMNRGLGVTMASMAQLLSTYPTGDTRDHMVAGDIAEVDTLTVTGVPTTSGNVTVTLNGVAKTVAVKIGSAEVASLLVTAVPTVAGNVTVTLNGIPQTVAIDPAVETTTALVAAKIGGTFFSGWVANEVGSTVTFTSTTTGTKTPATYSAGTTGATGTMTTPTPGVAEATTTIVATELRAASYPGWTVSGSGSIVIFTSTTKGVKASPAFSGGTTGTTASMVITTKGEAANYHRYFWNGTAWTDGGLYQAMEVGPGSVSWEKTNFIQMGKNLFNVLTITPNAFQGTSIITYNSSAYHLSDYIPIKAGKSYTASNGVRLLVTFNAAKQYLANPVGDSHQYTPTTFTATQDGYMRVSIYIGAEKTMMIAEGFSVLPYSKYGYVAPDLVVENLQVNSVKNGTIEPGAVSANKTNFLNRSKNLFNPDTVEEHVFLDANGTYGTDPTIADKYNVSDYIEVEAGTYYTINICRAFAVFDANKIWVFGSNPGSHKVQTFKPLQDGYLRFSYGRIYTEVQVEEGEVVTAYQGFGYSFEGLDGGGMLQDSLDGAALIDKSVDGLKLKEASLTPKHLNFLTIAKNKFDKAARVVGTYVSPDGNLSSLATYDTSDFMPVSAGVAYTSSPRCRKLAFFDSSFTPIPDQFIDGNASTITPLQTGFVRISYYAVDADIAQFEQGAAATTYEGFGYSIDGLILKEGAIRPSWLNTEIQDQLAALDAMAAGAAVQKLNVANADKVGLIGDSYTESHFTVKGKAYINKLSLFSDFNFENFAQSGDTYRGNLNRIRTKSPIYHGSLSWQDFKPKYALLISYTNDLKYMDNEQYANDLRAVIETVRGLGAIPIISTEYHSNFGNGIQNLMRQVAEEYGAEFVNILPRVSRTRGIDFADFWGGSHPGTRSNSIMSDNLETHLEKLPRPRQSLKLFRKRAQTAAATLDNLIFGSNEERAAKFKEINVGHSAINDAKYVDKVNSIGNSKVYSEYLMLQNNESISFTDYCLVSAVLPSTNRGLASLALVLSNTAVSVYVKNVVAAPYPSPTRYQRFDMPDTSAVVVGDKYTSNDVDFDSKVFTVTHKDAQSIFTSPYDGSSTDAGVLTRVSGSGPATLNYTYTSVGTSADYPAGKPDIGHWIQVAIDGNGKFTVPEALIKTSVDYDKANFLIVKSGAFTLNKVEVEWSGREDKVYRDQSLKVIEPRGAELLTQTLMGTSGELAGWSVTGSLTPAAPADGTLPTGTTGCVEVSTVNKLSQTFTVAANDEDVEYVIKAYARYFPSISDPAGTEFSITEDSYDYARLAIDISGSKVFTQSRRVNLHWKEVEFRVLVPYGNTTQTIKLYSLDKNIQLAKVSARLMY